MSPARSRLVLPATVLLVLVGVVGCTRAQKKPSYIYDADAFRAALYERAPELSERMRRAPFEVPESLVTRARKRVMKAPPGPDRVRALVAFLSDPEPDGIGLTYDWATSTTAERTLELGRGNCVSLATVLVGLGRGLRWPIYFAEARTKSPETHEFKEVTVLSDHMVVIVAAKSVRMVIDFLGLVAEGYEIRPIDDLTAYAHLINNVSGHRLIGESERSPEEEWTAAMSGFELATRIQPNLGRAWNNLGIAYARFGRFDDARAAYHRALQLDTAFGSAGRNLTIMETRAQGAPVLLEGELP